jgi:hydrogenase expression/formation protein HypE
MNSPALNGFVCPAPVAVRDTVVLGHGSGGRLSAELLHEVFLPALANPVLSRLEDQAVLEFAGSRLAFTTDSFVVKPLFFRGGDIGSLAVHGTINDLAMGGARPVALSAAFILEEGFSLAELRRIAASMARAAESAGVPIVTGDTKVVERGSGDGVYINTAGIGQVAADLNLSAANARPGDAVILSGSIGDHGMTILTEREGLEVEGALESDSAPLHTLVEAVLGVTREVRAMRDPTRGGLASVLNEIASQSGVGITLREDAIPVHEAVRGAGEILGLDPLYVANEGKMVAIVPAVDAAAIVAAMRRHPLGSEAAVIGEVTAREPGLVTLRTSFGTTRIVDTLAGDQLPRIC